jgi:hypothetical protein
MPDTDPDVLRAYLDVADHLLDTATKEQLAEAARFLALNVAHYRQRYGDLPLANFQDMLHAQTIGQATGELLAMGMEQLVGVLGVVMGLDGEHAPTDVH